jgi:hypothetical protein
VAVVVTALLAMYILGYGVLGFMDGAGTLPPHGLRAFTLYRPLNSAQDIPLANHAITTYGNACWLAGRHFNRQKVAP